ncbi:MAG: hypothetical protein HZC41_16585 [Chloroflexi bacterium]|nr:hypothetical protein [Chloroflexota bacterium]
MAIPRKPRLVFQSTIRRKQYFRRFAWSTLAAVAALAAVLALDFAANRGVADRRLLLVGGVAGIAAVVWFGVRAVVNLWRGLRRRDEDLRFFDKGFVWTRGKEQYKYGWSQVATFREGGSGIYVGRRPVLQWGAHTLRMLDGRVLKITGAHGSLRQFADAVRRYPARVTGTRMAQTLRQEQPVKLHPRLTLWPGGIEAGRHEIPWSQVEVRVRNGRLVILRRGASGKFHVIRRYNIRQVDNVGGLMDLAPSTIRNHQRERFEKRQTASEGT